MKVKIVGRMIVLGTMLVLAEACNPLASSLGVPDFLKGHPTHWYESTVSHGTDEDWKLESNLACENAIAAADKANHGKFQVKKIVVTGVMKDDRLISTTCRVEI
ncbi:MAG: hypothetical protein ACYC9S_09725 [Leptospirales bacterium]